ncbi:MAG TPA: hypothetical protein VLA09_07370 [Longimicrobiales bacterium]|nr:hypothetical protein [Longimicrobiales bacterium]
MSSEAPLGPLGSAEVSVKLFVEDPDGVRPGELIPVLHRWIREDLLEGELPIDVANYEHVPKGPGVVLICDKAHYYFDLRGGRAGLRYRGRREARASGRSSVSGAFRAVLLAARLLESDAALGGRYAFETRELEFGIYDRLRAPSDERTLAAVRPDLLAAVSALYGTDDVDIGLASAPNEPFMASVRVGTSVSPSVEELLRSAVAIGS